MYVNYRKNNLFFYLFTAETERSGEAAAVSGARGDGFAKQN